MEIDLKKLAGPCVCGGEHRIEVRKILLGPGVLEKLPALLSGLGAFRAPAVVCDRNTFSATGEAVLKLLPGSACVCLDPGNLHADERAVAAAEAGLPPRTDLLIAAGSGTIHDIARYCAKKRGVPFVSVPTAASVDGFVSTVAAMTWNGFKKTFPAVSPVCVVADSRIFSKAPRRLTASGVSDLLGKFTALADWKASPS